MEEQNVNFRRFFLFSAPFSLLTLFLIWYVGQERYIYFWDYQGYHSSYRFLGWQLADRPFQAVGSVIASIRKNDYNMLPTLFQMPAYFVLGPSRIAYILAIAASFAFPAIVFFTRLMAAIHGGDARTNKGNDLLLTLVAISVIAFCPQLWAPVLRGYVDVVGLNIIFIVLMLYFRHDLAEQTPRHLIALGFLLSLLILLRRWYAYWVVGFFCAMSVAALVSPLLDRTPMKTVQLRCQNILLIGATAVLSFFAIATPIAVEMLTTNYRDVYAAYRTGNSLFSHVGYLCEYFGIPFVVASVAGLLLMSAKERTRRIALFVAVQFAVTFILFTRTQDMGIHHFYWVSATLFLLTAFFLRECCSWLRTPLLKRTFVSGLIVAGVANFLSVFHPGVRDFFSPAIFAFPERYFYPLTRKDLDQVRNLLLTLDTLTRDSDGKIYVLTSSWTLNGDIARSGCHTFTPALVNLERNLLYTYDVDKREGFPLQFFQAQYVVVTNPVGYHLAPENQRVVGLLAEELLKGEGLGRSYERLPFAFALEDGSTATIYKKNTHFRANDLKRLSDTFVGLYPEYKEKFEIKSEIIRELSDL